MGIKVKTCGTVTRRFKEVRKDGKETFCIAVSDGAEKYPNVLKFKASDKEQLDCAAVGNKVEVEFWIDGREWTSPEKKVLYFADFKIASIRQVEDEPRVDAAEIGRDEVPDDIPF